MLEVYILQLFGAYGSDVLVIVTGILAIITGFYAFQTWRTNLSIPYYKLLGDWLEYLQVSYFP